MLTPPPPSAPVPSWPLQQVGPAQCDWLVHFCGRAPGASPTRWAPEAITELEPWERLDQILWDQRLLGFPPFGSEVDQPMLCLSESPPDHLEWLLDTRGWEPWGLFFERQCVYHCGGGPVWPARTQQFNTLSREQRPWAVRLDTTPERRSDWLFEREWRLPLPADDPALPLSEVNLVGILVGDPDWRPTTRDEMTGNLISGATGELVYPGDDHAYPEVRPARPALWEGTAMRISWNRATRQFGPAGSMDTT